MIRTHWNHHVLHDPADLGDAPSEMEAAQAQVWANFVVLTPVHLPGGTHLAQQTLRC